MPKQRSCIGCGRDLDKTRYHYINVPKKLYRICNFCLARADIHEALAGRDIDKLSGPDIKVAVDADYITPSLRADGLI